MPVVYNIARTRGDDWDFAFRLRIKDSAEVVNITGWSGASMIRHAETGELIAQWVVTIDHNTAPGIVLLTLDKDVTKNLPIGNFKWDIELTTAGDKTLTYLRGTITIEEDTTYPEVP